MNTLGTLVMKFFHKYLADERGVSSNTINSYSDCVRLLLDYSSKQLGVSADKMRFDAISDQIILDFLDHIEAERKNMASTRNQRLAAIKTLNGWGEKARDDLGNDSATTSSVASPSV